MEQQRSKGFVKISKSTAFQTNLYLTIIIVITNLNALVDFFLHPEIPYFDKEHLIVGGITGFVSIVLFGLLFIYMRHLTNALNTIIALEKKAFCQFVQIVKKFERLIRIPSRWIPGSQ